MTALAGRASTRSSGFLPSHGQTGHVGTATCLVTADFKVLRVQNLPQPIVVPHRTFPHNCGFVKHLRRRSDLRANCAPTPALYRLTYTGHYSVFGRILARHSLSFPLCRFLSLASRTSRRYDSSIETTAQCQSARPVRKRESPCALPISAGTFREQCDSPPSYFWSC